MSAFDWTANELTRFTMPTITDKRMLKQADSHKRILKYIGAHPRCKEKDILTRAKCSRRTLLDLFDAGYLRRERPVGNGPLFYWLEKFHKEPA